jgi:pimeloyl-ACP methyl ester carboxylesterase
MITRTVELSDYGLSLSVNMREGEKGDILFIHGLGCSKESFNDAFENKELDGYRLIVPDLPGFGETLVSKQIEFDMASHANYLNSLLNLLNIDNPIIVAHSMGGAIGLILINHIYAVKHYFSLEGNLMDDDCTISRKVSNLSKNEFIIDKFNNSPLKYRCRGLESEPAPDPLAFYNGATSLVKLSDSGELLEAYKQLKCPKTYFYGSENSSLKAVSALAEEDTVEVPGCGHFMMTDNPLFTYHQIAKRIEET